MDIRDIVVRAAKTAVQSFLVAVPVEAITSANLPVLKAAAIAAGAAALSVIWNSALQWSQS